jgi:AcrR family transcriptional regulator
MSDQTTRQAILDAAKQLFTSKGFSSTTVREICQAADVTAPVVYYHFGNKEGLFEAVVKETLVLDDFCALLRERVSACPDPWNKLRTYVDVYMAQFPIPLLNPGLHLEGSTEVNALSLAQLEGGIAAILQLAAEVLAEGIRTKAFREVDIQVTAACLLGTIDSFVRARVYLGTDYDHDQVVACIVDLYTRGLTAQTAGAIG